MDPRSLSAAEIPVSTFTEVPAMHRSNGRDSISQESTSSGGMQASISVHGSAQVLFLPLEDAHESYIDQDFLLQMISICCTLFDFRNPAGETKDRRGKGNALLILKGCLDASCARSLTNAVTSALFNMFSINIFRPLPPDFHDDELAREPCWSHLELVYDILTIYIDAIHVDPESCTQYINELFIQHILNRFDSVYSSERRILKTILHLIQSKFELYRSFIRKETGNIFYQFAMETQPHNGIAELLDVSYGSIVSSFCVPLNKEHKEFMSRALIPLHKPDCMVKYFKSLCHSMISFVLKDWMLTEVVIKALLKYWPKTSSEKEVLFLQEVEALLEITGPLEFDCFMTPLFRQLAHCLNSPSFRVAEHTLLLWKNEYIALLIFENRQAVLPLIIGALENNNMSNQTWRLAINALASDVRQMFVDLDSELFQACLKDYQAKEESDKTAHELRVKRWKQLEEFADSRTPHA